jgi:quercetin dioxygenase-like cupin family protein
MEKEMPKQLRNGAIALGVAAVGAFAYGGSAHAETTPVAVEVLTPRAAFTDDASMQVRLKAGEHGTDVIKVSDPSNIVTTKVTVQPGAPIPWHTHHGPVFVTIVKGELTYISSEGCTSRRYPAGNAFIDPGHGHVHAAYNSGDAVTEFVATFFEAPTGDGPITIPADAPANCKIPTS